MTLSLSKPSFRPRRVRTFKREQPQYNYKMTIAYDGTKYHGWQIQPNGVSIQEVLQNTLKIFLREEVLLIGSGRTDAGVHALGQVAHFKLSQEADLYRFLGSANGLLPHDIRIKDITAVSPIFHAQYSATGKTYHYHLYLDPIQDPFRRLYSLHVHEKIDLKILQQAMSCFIGTHDFTSFANSAHEGTAAHDAVRTIKRFDIVPEEGGLRLEIEADGFLYKMVRNIVGTLLEVAANKRSVNDILKILETKDRRLAGKAAPPHGLFLVKVDYT